MKNSANDTKSEPCPKYACSHCGVRHESSRREGDGRVVITMMCDHPFYAYMLEGEEEEEVPKYACGLCNVQHNSWRRERDGEVMMSMNCTHAHHAYKIEQEN
jgi:hypothetical protein